MLANAYLDNAQRLLGRIQTTQLDSILEAASWITDSLIEGGVFHVFGSGHSHILADEAHSRAGGLVPIQPIDDPLEGKAERLVGYAAVLLNQYDVREGEVIIIASNSGINALPIEMALEAKKRGLRVIAVTSIAHTMATSSRYASGKKLHQVADLVIDNCGIVGDAAIEVTDFPGRAGATSSIAGVAIINSIVVQVAENLMKKGATPPILISSNVAGGDEHNERIRSQYRERLKKTMGPRYQAPGSK
jgi:uncharacterized phosphosugar-binding protein